MNESDWFGRRRRCYRRRRVFNLRVNTELNRSACWSRGPCWACETPGNFDISLTDGTVRLGAERLGNTATEQMHDAVFISRE